MEKKDLIWGVPILCLGPGDAHGARSPSREPPRAVVIGKDITAADGQLIFTLRINIPQAAQGSTVAYVVTKSQYDSYESGSIIDVQYRVDQDGRIAIVR